MRIFSNPKPIQTDYYVKGQQLVNFGLDFLNRIPVIWSVFTVVLLVGAIYYLAVQRNKPWTPVSPEGDDLTGVRL